MKFSRTTKRIFERSQRHEPMYEPIYYNVRDTADGQMFWWRYIKRLAAIKPNQVKQPKRIISMEWDIPPENAK